MHSSPIQHIKRHLRLLACYIRRFGKERVYKRMIVIFSFFLVSFLTLFFWGLASTGSNKGYVAPPLEEYREEEEKVALNHILTNEMSDFDGCEKLDRAIERFMRANSIKGASFAVMKDDRLLYAKGYGYINDSDSTACTVKNIFRVASVSKLITAIGIMKLKEDGKLQLSDKVFGPNGILNDSIYLNYRDKKLEMITVDDLLRHRGGFRSPHGDPMFNAKAVANYLKRELPLTTRDYVVYATRVGLRWKPGTSSRYSNLGYLILSSVIEKLSGREYEDYIKTAIFEPLGIYDIHIAENFPEDRDEHEVYYYDGSDSDFIKAYDGSEDWVEKANGGNDVKALLGAGAWVASPVELLRLVAAVDDSDYRPNILSDSSITEMTQPQRNLIPIGWAKVTKREWFRSGNMSGTNALIKREPDGSIWVFVTNTSSWKGPKFYLEINSNIRRALNRVKEWPEGRDLFNTGL